MLEAFIFRIQYKMKMGRDSKEDNLVRVETKMSKGELALCNGPPVTSPMPLVYATEEGPDMLTYRGIRWRTKFSFCLKMYAEEVKEWLDHAELEERRSNEWLVLNLQSPGAEVTARWGDGQENRRTFTLWQFLLCISPCTMLHSHRITISHRFRLFLHRAVQVEPPHNNSR